MEFTYMDISAITIADAKEQFSEIVNRVAHSKEHIILTRRGNEIAALIPIEDLKILIEALDKRDLREAIDSLKEARAQGTLSLDEFKHKIGNS